jgi:protein-S-isoprenylcysteine O-methyltransferase Ste14
MAEIASWVGLAMMIAGFVGLIMSQQVLSTAVPAIVLQVTAVLLVVWARSTFGRRSFHAAASPTDGGVVTGGPYRWLRHPIYTAGCLFGWGCWVGHPSWFSAGMAVLVTAGGIVRMFMEETMLVVRYPAYAEYARKTKRMIPYLF